MDKDSVEIKRERRLNSKTYSNPDGTRTLEAHTGHIHYLNKLGVGDGKSGYREIDWSLQWDKIRRGWFFEFHSFHPFLPEYSDGWVEFRDVFEEKDQTVRFKPEGIKRVLGRLVTAENLTSEGLDNLTGWNCVVYDNAFGEGIDYILYFTRSTLTKAVRIREGHKPSVDTSFEFEIELPRGEIKRGIDKDSISYVVDKAGEKEFDTLKQTLLGEDKGGGREWYTYLRPFAVWDDDKREIVKTVFSHRSGKTYLKKTVSKEFLDSSVGDVFTDTTSSYYSGVGDGYIYKLNAPWDDVHDATTGTADYAGTYATVSASQSLSGNCGLYRGFFPIDTSGLPDVAEISSAIFKASISFENTVGDYLFGLVQATQASTSSLSNDDYDQCGSVDSPTEGSARVSISYTGWKNFTLNSTGIGWISKTGYTKLGIRKSQDIDDISPVFETDGGGARFETSESSNDPYLEIVYTTPIDDSDERGGRITGQDTATNDRGGRIIGGIDATSDRGGRITGLHGDSSQKERKSSLPTDNADLSTIYTSQEVTDVGSSDDTRVPLEATTAGYLIHQYKRLNDNNTDKIDITWEGQSTMSTSIATVYLQIYNHNTTSWETLDTESEVDKDTDFTLAGSITINPSDYYDGDNLVSVRVYQQIT